MSAYQQHKMATHLSSFTQHLLLEARQRNTSDVTDSLLGTAPWITPHHIHWCVSPVTQAMTGFCVEKWWKSVYLSVGMNLL